MGKESIIGIGVFSWDIQTYDEDGKPGVITSNHGHAEKEISKEEYEALKQSGFAFNKTYICQYISSNFGHLNRHYANSYPRIEIKNPKNYWKEKKVKVKKEKTTKIEQPDETPEEQFNIAHKEEKTIERLELTDSKGGTIMGSLIVAFMAFGCFYLGFTELSGGAGGIILPILGGLMVLWLIGGIRSYKKKNS